MESGELTCSVSTPDVVVRDYASADYSACPMLWDLSWSSALYPQAGAVHSVHDPVIGYDGSTSATRRPT